MAKEIMIECPSCNCAITAEVPSSVLNSGSSGGNSYPTTRAAVKPFGTSNIYKITTDQIEKFLSAKLEHYHKGSTLTLMPNDSNSDNRKRKKQNRGLKKITFPALQIALSDSVIDCNSGEFINRIGIDPDDVRIVRPVWNEMIKRYMFNRKDLIKIAENDDEMDLLNQKFNIDSIYMKWLIKFAVPQKENSTVLVNIDLKKVLLNMLEDPNDHGAITSENIIIRETNSISDESMEFIVDVASIKQQSEINPEVRLLMKSHMNK